MNEDEAEQGSGRDVKYSIDSAQGGSGAFVLRAES